MIILQVHNFYRTRGGECSVVDIERALLEKHGHEVIPYYRDSRNIDKYGLLARARMLINVPYNKKVEMDLEATIHDVKPDVAHVHNVFPMLTAAVYKVLNRCGVPVVQTVHNFRFLCPNGQFYIHNHICEDCQKRSYFSAVKNRCMQDSILVSSAYAAAISYAWKTEILPNNIDRYIALNQFFAKRLINAGVPSSRIRVLGNFTDNFEKSVSLKQGYALYLGRLSREKGLHTLLDAWERVDSITLKIAGSGPLSKEIGELIANRNVSNVQLLGHVSGVEKTRLIKNAICMVVPSEWYENFPMSVVEAMSLGTPVIASRIGGLPDMVEHGVTGYLFKPGDVNELAKFINILFEKDNIVKQMSSQAMVVSQTKFNPTVHLKDLIDIYNDAILCGK